MDIYLETSLEPFHNDTLYNNFVTELEVLLTPWVIKIARLLVDDDRFVSTNQKYSCTNFKPKSCATYILLSSYFLSYQGVSQQYMP